MTIHLDTSFLIRALVTGSAQDRQLRNWLRERRTIEMSAVAWAEFLCGPLAATELEIAERIVTRRVPFDSSTAALAAELFNAGGRRRGSLNDCMIAATALESEATLATSNTKDFHRLGLTKLRLSGI